MLRPVTADTVSVPSSERPPAADADLALVFSGGGARAAYQVGFLRHLASRYPDLSPGILTGVSAGGIVATLLAARPGSLGDAAADLSAIWQRLHLADVFRVEEEASSGVDVSSKAIFFNLKDNQHYLFVEESPGVYSRKAVKVATELDGHAAITEGVMPGQRVVTDGCLLLQSLLESGSSS